MEFFFDEVAWHINCAWNTGTSLRAIRPLDISVQVLEENIFRWVFKKKRDVFNVWKISKNYFKT